jgi:hypothetical protein|tara:strand:+ start:2102 stop:2830 length:729 start_codon:yes stop_codon:yes gene_type:complete
MRVYLIRKIEHVVYDKDDVLPSHIIPKDNWRTSKIGDWVKTDDDCIIQILRKGKMLQRDRELNYVGTCTGTFICKNSINMDTKKRTNIYSFGGSTTPSEVVEQRKELTTNEHLFVTYLQQKMKPVDAYLKAFPTNNPSYAKVKAYNLFKTQRVRTAMKEELKPVMEELGIDDRLVLSGIKAEALSADKADTRLKALFKLADILDLEEKSTTKTHQVTGAVFQGFTNDMLEVAERKELTDGKK